jgi:hypothetical protein
MRILALSRSLLHIQLFQTVFRHNAAWRGGIAGLVFAGDLF